MSALQMTLWTAVQVSFWRLMTAMLAFADLLPLCIAEQRARNVLLHNYLSRTIVLHERRTHFIRSSNAGSGQLQPTTMEVFKLAEEKQQAQKSSLPSQPAKLP
jgi:Tfp pilus assembly PilM family ATPase